MALSPVVVALLFAGAVSVVLAVGGWRRREVAGSLAFAVMMVAVAVWTTGSAFRLSATTPGAYWLWSTVVWAGIATTPYAGFVFVLRYTGRDRWVTHRVIALLAVAPALTYALVVTTSVHGLVWEYTGPLITEPVTHRPADLGLGFYVHMTVVYGLLLVLLGLLAERIYRSRGVHRWQSLVMFLGALTPLAANAVWMSGLSPFHQGADLTPLAFAVTGAMFAVGLYSFDLLDLAPVARHTVVEELSDAVLTVDREGRIVDANSTARALLNGSDDLVGESARDVVPAYESIVDGDEVDVVVDADGRPRYFDARTTTLRDDGEVVGRVVLLRDVTERRRVERRYQSLIEKASDVITVHDADGTVRYASPSVRNVLGYEPAEIDGRSLLAYVHPDDWEAVRERFEELLADPDARLRAEYRFRAANGEWRVVESRGRNLLDDPVAEGIVVNSRDVTERRERERRLEAQNEQLEEFASVITHDLRNPLSVARGYAQLLDEAYDDDRIENVVDAHGRMEELLEDLLALAREGRTVGETNPVDLGTAATRAWANVETAEATLELDLADRTTVAADDSRLREAFENLFRNAVDHGGEDVTVRIAATESGFYVEDDGPGIPEGESENVFEAGESSTADGTGFGLAIVRRIAGAHGWEVTATDGELGGARFAFSEVEWIGDEPRGAERPDAGREAENVNPDR